MEIERRRDTVIAYLTGELDHCSAQCIRRELDALIADQGMKRLVLDMKNMSFMDSSGIAVVINTLRLMTKIEGKLLLAGLGSQPMKVFRTSGIDKLVEIKEVVS